MSFKRFTPILAIASIALASALPAHAEDCATGLSEIDQALSSTELSPEAAAQIGAMREDAVSRQSNGDAEGCLNTVNNMKSMLGL